MIVIYDTKKNNIENTPTSLCSLNSCRLCRSLLINNQYQN